VNTLGDRLKGRRLDLGFIKAAVIFGVTVDTISLQFPSWNRTKRLYLARLSDDAIGQAFDRRKISTRIVEEKCTSHFGWCCRLVGGYEQTLGNYLPTQIWILQSDLGQHPPTPNARLASLPPNTNASRVCFIKHDLRKNTKFSHRRAHSKDEWAKGIEEFYKRKVPVYFTERYSVFAEKSDNYPVRVYPESVVPECKRVLASLDTLFQRYERSEGRHSDF